MWLDGEAVTHMGLRAFWLVINTTVSPVDLNDLLLYFCWLQLLHGLLLDWRNLILSLETELSFICQTQFCMTAGVFFALILQKMAKISVCWIFFGFVRVACQTMLWNTICFETVGNNGCNKGNFSPLRFGFWGLYEAWSSHDTSDPKHLVHSNPGKPKLSRPWLVSE